MRNLAIVSLAAWTLAVTAAASPAQSIRHRPRASVIVPVPMGLQVLAHNDLTFGTVLPGIPVLIEPRDGLRAALFEIQGPNGAAIRIELALPDAMIDEDGARLPLFFGPRAATFGIARGPHEALNFNPNNPLITMLSGEGRLFVRLGGTAQPTRPQDGGSYRGTILLTVFDIGS